MTHKQLSQRLTIEGAQLINRLSQARELLSRSLTFLPPNGTVQTAVQKFLDEGLFGK